MTYSLSYAPPRFRSKVTILENGCWQWTGAIAGGTGYPQIGIGGGKIRRAHRIAYEFFIGPIPEGLQLDHLCRNRACVNPEHLEPVTNRENALRGVGACAINARKTHCKRGHEFTPENTYVDRNGGRGCRICRRYLERRWRKAQRAEGDRR